MLQGIALTPGPHRIEVLSPGHTAKKVSVEAEAGKKLQVTIELDWGRRQRQTRGGLVIPAPPRPAPGKAQGARASWTLRVTSENQFNTTSRCDDVPGLGFSATKNRLPSRVTS